ncbi:MAG: phage baseplate assembly protein V [Acidisphaera sp.]|nr:phage baseplate assembly protein V [Acidisphaera sp.]
MDRFLNALKAQAGALDQGQGQPRFGLVTSVDPTSYTARVALQPEGVITGWLPILSAWVGGGWGMACPPTPGQQVLVLAQEGDAEHGVIAGGAYSNTALPPPAPSGELWLVHQSGTFLKLHNDGTVEGKAAHWNLTGDLTLTGNIVASGNISDLSASHGSLDTLRQIYDSHTHADPQGGQSAPPSQQD